MSVRDYNYLIIGGEPKAGTTSLYKWLSDHPEACASSIKETRFFLDADYPLPSSIRFDGRNLEDYGEFYKNSRESSQVLRIEATPDYLYSNNALQIAELLPKAKILFVIRDPVERMVSWYNYAKQRALISEGMTFDDYVKIQIYQNTAADTPIHLRALEQCCNMNYLSGFQEVFGDRCCVFDFNQLKMEPCKVMMKICSFTGLDSRFYDNYPFIAENVTHVVDHAKIMRGYNSIRARVTYYFHNRPGVINLLKKPNKVLKLLFFNKKRPVKRIETSNETENLIRCTIADFNKKREGGTQNFRENPRRQI